MSELANPIRTGLLFWKRVWLAWLATVVVLLVLFIFVLSRTMASERMLAWLSSALSFLAACSAGRQAGKIKLNPFLGGLLCAANLIGPLLLCGLLIDQKSLSSDSVLSLVSLSFSGALVGSVFLGKSVKKRRNQKPFLQQNRGRRKS